MFANISIRTRLVIAFGTVLLLMTACVVTGVWGLSGMFAMAHQAVTNDVQIAQHAARINVLVLNERRYEKDTFINIADADKRASYKKKWDGDRVNIQAEVAAMHQLQLSDEDRAAIGQVGTQLAAYADGFSGIVKQIEASQIRTTQDANTAMGAFKGAVHGLEENSEKVNAHGIELVNAIDGELSATRTTTRHLLLGLGGAALLLGLVLCVSIIRSITLPLRRAVEVSRSVASGKLDNVIVAAGRDETGELLVALKSKQDNLLHSKLNYEGQLDSISATQAVVEFSPDGTVETANQNFLRTMGYTLEDVRGKHHRMFIDSTQRDSGDYRGFWDKLGRGEAYSGQLRCVDRNGKDVWLQGIYSPIKGVDGKPFKVVQYATDVTVERSTAQMNAAFKGALAKLDSSVVVADNEFNIVYVNDAGQALMSRVQAEFRKDLPAFDASRLIGSSVDVLSKDSGQQRNRISKLDASVTDELLIGGRTMKLTMSPMKDDTGRRLGTVLEWLDRTEEVRTEAEVQGMVAAVTDGRLEGRIDLKGKTGAYLNLSRGINGLVDTIDSVVKNVRSLVEAANAGDLTRRIQTDGAPGLQVQLGGGINGLTENMATLVSQVKHAAGEVGRGADEISQGNTNLSQRTEEQASSLEETASSMEEMTSTVKHNSDNAAHANQLAVAARGQAETGGAVVSRAVNAMSGINEASRKIADIISVIDEIAFQTNLLALNAAVEAARAGEQGRGFAVVATEVRNLAGRSATAAKEIKALIQDSVAKVSEGSELVNQSGETLQQIVTSVKKVSDIVAEIAASSLEQSAGIEQVNKAVMQLDELTQQNAALVEEASAASQSMADQARGLNGTLSRYRVGGDAGNAMTEASGRTGKRRTLAA